MRLDAYLAKHTQLSRKEAGLAIRAGEVSINGLCCRDRGYTLKPGEEAGVRYRGQSLQENQAPGHLLLYKPAGVITATEDRQQETVMDLLPPAWLKQGLVPVGRLDKDTEGLLFFTRDGRLHHRLLSPARGVEKIYHFSYEGAPFGVNEQKQVERGLLLDDGLTRPARLVLDPDQRRELGAPAWCFSEAGCGEHAACLILHEGRFHQVKRMCTALGGRLTRLYRSHFGPLSTKGLQPGEYREATAEEIQQLKELTKLENQG